MIIFWLVAESLSVYQKLMESGELGAPERPQRCARCGGRNCFWAHGWYERTVEENGQLDELEIARFKCSVCGKTVSVLPWFVIPRRRYTMKTVAAGVEGYAGRRETYKEGATKLGAEGPSPAQLFRWVSLVAERAMELLLDVQAWCVSAEVTEDELLDCEAAECPNSWKAQIPGKAQLLGHLAKLVAYGKKSCKGTKENVMHGLGMQFLQDVEQMQQIFAHDGLWKQTPQRMKP
jgi:hypothetical protein